MPSRRMLPDTVTLFNYVGEVNDVATYQKAIIKNCYCPINEGAVATGNGTAPSDRATLYIFDRGSVVTDENGNKLAYKPREEWDALQNKAGFWTLHQGPTKDYFIKSGDPEKMSVTGFNHLTGGTPRMWHFEVKGS